jgi:hypothetical protein
MLKTQLTRIAFTILAVSMLCSVARADGAPTLTLDSTNGAISGAPGATVGWGFTLTNTTDFLVVSSSDFCVGAITSPCSNSLGTYTDFIGPQFQVVGPSPENTSFTQSFNLLAQTGAGSFTINSSAPPGDSVIGEIVVTYDLYSVDPNNPNFDPSLDTLSTGDMLDSCGECICSSLDHSARAELAHTFGEWLDDTFRRRPKKSAARLDYRCALEPLASSPCRATRRFARMLPARRFQTSSYRGKPEVMATEPGQIVQEK